MTMTPMKVMIDGVEYVKKTEVTTDDKVLAALEIRFDSDCGDNITIRDYLYKLMHDLWAKGENFNSKRPFGNSGWEYDLYHALARGGAINAEIDEDGEILECDTDEGSTILFDMISAIFYGKK